MRTELCAVCGKEFETDAPNVKYCCPKCKVTGAKILRTKWIDAHPDYNSDYYRRRKSSDTV